MRPQHGRSVVFWDVLKMLIVMVDASYEQWHPQEVLHHMTLQNKKNNSFLKINLLAPKVKRILKIEGVSNIFAAPVI
jgi:hypothetical protein